MQKRTIFLVSLIFFISKVKTDQELDEPDANTIEKLMKECKPGVLDTCDMCSLCENGAFCRQTINNQQPMFMQGSMRLNRTHNSRSSNLASNLNYLKSLIDFTCYCVPGFTGTYCQRNINECLMVQCLNNATCIDLINGFKCDCPAGFTGKHCETNIDECASSPCMSGSECYDLIDGFYCKCLPGYTGRTCSVDINECEPVPCQNNARCIDLVNKFECDCTDTGFTGEFCQVNIDDCKGVTCQHNSTCVDGINSFKCKCHPGFKGQLCEHDIDECLSNPCIYGQCWQNSDRSSFDRRIQYLSNIPSTTRSRRSGWFTQSQHEVTKFIDLSFSYKFNYEKAAGYWCECQPGYTGTNCETKINECRNDPCGKNGKCLDLINKFECECYNGFEGKTCQENVNECKVYQPCAKSTKCIDIVPDYESVDTSNGKPYLPGYKCDCSNLNSELFNKNGNEYVLYTGQNCTMELNSCQKSNRLCMHNSTCISSINTSTSQQEVNCQCLPGFTGKYCQYITSIRFDGSYAVDSGWSNQSLIDSDQNTYLKFDFRLKFFTREEHQLPLVYFQDKQNQLAFEINVHRHYLSIQNHVLGLRKHLAFYYPTNPEEIWHTLEVKIRKSTAHVIYSVKKLHLTETKRINVQPGVSVTAFKLGQFYWENDQFLNGACMRDVILNGEYMFKINPYISLDPKIYQPVKYGCSKLENQCLSINSPNGKCINNAKCVHRWYDYECANCKLPYYGRNCHLVSQKLGFIRPLSELVLISDSEHNLNTPPMFHISFRLSRISKSKSPNQKIYFSTLKQSDEPGINYYYLIGIDEHGFINLKKIFFDGSRRTTQWSLSNHHLSINYLSSVKISLKLSRKLIEINLNDEYMSRYEIVDERSVKVKRAFNYDEFQVDEIKFANTFLNNSELFLLYDLQIMNKKYEFVYQERSDKVKLNILNRHHLNYGPLVSRFKLRKSSNIMLFNSTLKNIKIVTDLNKDYCPEIETKNCYELNGSVRRMGSTRLLSAKTINCSRTDPIHNKCSKYTAIHRELFSRTERPHQSIINYYFDFDDTNTLNRRSRYSVNQRIIGYSSLGQQERLVLMRDIDIHSLSFDMNLSPKSFASVLNYSTYDTKTNLFTLNTFDELSRNRLFLFGVNLHRLDSDKTFQIEVFTKVKTIKSPVIKSTIKTVNLTFTATAIHLKLNNEELVHLTHKHLISKSLLKAYGSFMLNFTHNPGSKIQYPADSLVSACISNFALQTKKTIGNQSQYFTYDLIQQTKSLYIINENTHSNEECLVKTESNRIENDESPYRNKDCFLIEKISIDTNEKLDNSYHCKCNTSDSCPYDFWSNKYKMSMDDSREFGEKVGCAQAGDYACFNNGTCIDHEASDSNNLSYSCKCPSFFTGSRCESFDPCLENPCSPDSVCESKITNDGKMTYECMCNEGFEGRNCTIDLSKTCFASPCENGATCINVTLISDPQTLGYECMCSTGFEGKNCKNKIDFCEIYEPCGNNGKCVNLESFTANKFYECQCLDGWTGANCTQDIDECAQMRSENVFPCSNNGICLNTPGSFICTCNEYFYGRTCEQTHICQREPKSSRPCKNGALCLINGSMSNNEYECKCPYGFTGEHCEFPTCDSQPCKHDSVCEMLNATTFRCNCSESGYFGPRCNFDLDERECLDIKCNRNYTCNPENCDCDALDCAILSDQIRIVDPPKEFMYHLVLWPLLGIMLALLMILFTIFVMKMKKARATHGTYSPSRHEQQASRIEFNMDLKRPPEERLI